MKDIRSLATLTFEAAHRVSEAALELERSAELRRVKFYGAQIADAGVSGLAHVACAFAAMPPWDVASQFEARGGLKGARDCFDTLDQLLRTCEHQGILETDRIGPLHADIAEAMALVRALMLELHTGRALAA